MTRKVFWEDPYLSSLDAIVESVDGAEVCLDATIFFAFSGGQERDHGTIGGREVRDARWDGPTVRYRLDSGHGLEPGEAVEIVIDAERRDRLRRLHMATEIVLVLLTRADPGLEKVGAHIAADKGRIDFVAEGPLQGRLGPIEAATNAMVADDLAIVSEFSDAAAERRYWEIAGFARVPCSGTHPRRTGEIGPIRLRRRNPGKAKERVEITLGHDV